MEAATTTHYGKELTETCPARENEEKKRGGSRVQICLSQMRDENDDDKPSRP